MSPRSGSATAISASRSGRCSPTRCPAGARPDRERPPALEAAETPATSGATARRSWPHRAGGGAAGRPRARREDADRRRLRWLGAADLLFGFSRGTTSSASWPRTAITRHWAPRSRRLRAAAVRRGRGSGRTGPGWRSRSSCDGSANPPVSRSHRRPGGCAAGPTGSTRAAGLRRGQRRPAER